jgi:ketohexokinase
MILLTGIVTLDIVSHVDHYPREDEELRALQMQRQTGGNAANTARVLAQLGHRPGLLANIATDSDGDWLAAGLQANGIDIRYSPRLRGHTPTSCITINRQNGSRTIVHFRDLPELAADVLHDVPLDEYVWFHFEGRNIAATREMLNRVRAFRVDQPVSLEIEKDRPGIDSLFELADILLFSASFLAARGLAEAAQLFSMIRPLAPEAILICSRGEAGAWAQSADGEIIHAPATIPASVVDTLGAGDTFNAGLIHALQDGQLLVDALAYACRLAGRKVGQAGFSNLA